MQQVVVALVVSFVLGNLYAIHQLRHLKQTAYRAHDQYTKGKRYQPGIDVNGVSVFGDLCATSGAPHPVRRIPRSALSGLVGVIIASSRMREVGKRCSHWKVLILSSLVIRFWRLSAEIR